MAYKLTRKNIDERILNAAIKLRDSLHAYFLLEGISTAKLPVKKHELMRLGRWFCDSLSNCHVTRRKGIDFNAINSLEYGHVLYKIALAYRTGRDIGEPMSFCVNYYTPPIDDGFSIMKSYKYRRSE